MRQHDGSELFGEDDPRGASIGIIEVEPEDSRRSVLTAIMTQNKLGRKYTVLVLPDQNKSFSRAVDFEGLRDTQRNLQTQLAIVASKNSDPARFARQNRFSVFLSLENYASYAQSFLKREPVPEVVQEPAPAETAESQSTATSSESQVPQDIAEEPTRPLPRPVRTMPAPTPTPAITPVVVRDTTSTEEPTRPLPAPVQIMPEPAPASVPADVRDPAFTDQQPEIADRMMEPPPVALIEPGTPLEPEEPAPASVPAAEEQPVPPQEVETMDSAPLVGPSIIDLRPVQPARARDAQLPALVEVSAPPTRRRRSRRGCVIAALLVLLLLIGGIALASLAGVIPIGQILPIAASSATITVTPDSRTLVNTYTIPAVTQLPDTSQHQVRARFLNFATPQQSQSAKATGIGSVPAIQAHGTLTFYNALAYAQTVPAGAVFTDANGVQVVNDQAAIIAAAQPPLEGAATVPAHAIQPGAKGNISAHDFSISQCCHVGITLENGASFSGGVDAQTYTYVQQSDIDSAASALKGPLIMNAQRSIQAQILPGEQLVKPIECTPGVVADHQAGERAASVLVSEMVNCLGEVYDQQGARTLATSLLQASAQRSPGANYTLVGRIATQVKGAMVTDAKGTIAVQVGVVGQWVYQFSDAQKKLLARLIAGKSTPDAQAALARQAGVKGSTIALSGGTNNVLPGDPSAITVIVQPPGANKAG
ncbi:MAG: baseplate J/gp47 family protein [Chloroflexota bacterium]|nr:baseplate J/gp47 family protein [Chloroflexota bacterium]